MTTVVAKAKTKRTSKKAGTPAHPPFRKMILEAIAGTHHAGKGASRTSIANYIKENYKGLSDGAAFNSHLKKALLDGVAKKILEQGETLQRFKLTVSGKNERKRKTKVTTTTTAASTGKKSPKSPRKSSKKKGTTSKKKKTSSKSKSKKGKTSSKKKKTSSGSKKRKGNVKKKGTSGKKKKTGTPRTVTTPRTPRAPKTPRQEAAAVASVPATT